MKAAVHLLLICGCEAVVMRVLVVEDDLKLAAVIRRGFALEGIATDLAAEGEQALVRAQATRYDVVVLDVMLPKSDGFEICRRLRAQGDWTAVLMLTARTTIADRVRGLDCGADDYLGKPFSFAELLARVRALSRRAPVERPVVLEAGDLSLDPATHRAWRGDASVELSAREFALLEAFMRRPGEIISRFELLEHAWPYEYENRSNIIEVYIRYLREKIDRPFERNSLQTVRGVGYRLCPND